MVKRAKRLKEVRIRSFEPIKTTVLNTNIQLLLTHVTRLERFILEFDSANEVVREIASQYLRAVKNKKHLKQIKTAITNRFINASRLETVKM